MVQDDWNVRCLVGTWIPPRENGSLAEWESKRIIFFAGAPFYMLEVSICKKGVL